MLGGSPVVAFLVLLIKYHRSHMNASTLAVSTFPMGPEVYDGRSRARVTGKTSQGVVRSWCKLEDKVD